MTSSRIQVANGHFIDPLNPDPDAIDVTDIAHALAHQCRFSGHIKKFYSVAEHSVRVSWAVSTDDALWALLHDASEAYLVDVPSPIKNGLFGEPYREAEERLMNVICAKYGLPATMPEWVRYADNSLLATEVRDLLEPTPDAYRDFWEPWLFAEPQHYKIEKPWPPERAKFLYIATFYDLISEEIHGRVREAR